MAASSNNQNAVQAAMDTPARESNIRENTCPYQPRPRQRIQETNPQNAPPPRAQDQSLSDGLQSGVSCTEGQVNTIQPIQAPQEQAEDVLIDWLPYDYSAFTIRRTLADLVFLRDRKLVPLCRLLPHLLLWVLL